MPETTRTGSVIEWTNAAWLITTVILMAASFLATHSVTSSLDELGVFEQPDVVFDADVSFHLEYWMYGRRPSLKHPIEPLIVGLPIRALARIGDMLSLVPRDEASRQLALLVPAIFAALKCGALILLCWRIRITLLLAVMLALINGASFSQLILGSVPESYPITSCGFAVLFCLAAYAQSPRSEVRFWPWTLGLAFFFGITPPMMVPAAGILLCFQRPWATGWRTAIGKTAKISAVAVSIVMSAFLLTWDLQEVSTEKIQRETDFHARRMIGNRVKESLRQYPFAVVNTFTPPTPEIGLNSVNLEAGNRYIYSYYFFPTTANGWEIALRYGAVFTLLSLGLWGWRRVPSEAKPVALFAMILILFNLIFYLFWRVATLTNHSLHWQFGLIVVLAGVSYLPDPVRRFRAPVLALTALAVLWNSLHVLEFIFRSLPKMGADY